MNDSHTSRDRRQIIVSGDKSSAGHGSQVNIATGSKIRQENISHDSSVEIRDPRGALGAELARMRLSLQADGGAATADDRDDAIDAVDGLQRVLPDMDEGDPDSRKTFRRRIRALIGVLAPVAEIIGGVAALEAIVHQLR
jgi:hypothetical protein